MAELHDWDLVSVVEDPGVSAGSLNRDGLQRLLAKVRKRDIDGVIVYKLDRLTRSQRDLIVLLDLFQRYGVRLVSVSEHLDTESANGKFFLGMLILIAEWERGIISERTRCANEQLRKDGKRFSGRPPYGWDYTEDGKMIEVPEEQETLEIMRGLAKEGLSLSKIGNELLQMDRKPRTAKKWHPKVLASLLRTA